jgi:serine/threonine protein kinase
MKTERLIVFDDTSSPENGYIGGMATQDITIGVLVDERYEIVESVGAGGMCFVYRAKQLKMDREVAIKVPHAHLLLSGDSLKRFKREAVAVSKLNHPNIVQTFGGGVWNDRPYMAMEFLDGESLAAKIARDGKIDEDKAVKIFATICDALGHAHQQGIIHRDLKPSNVMLVGDEHTVKLVDFGIAKIMPESGQEMQRLTQTGQLIGTIIYMAPELALGQSPTAQCDFYSFGCLMYETLSGHRPFEGDSPFELIAKHASEAALPIAGISEGMQAIVNKCLAKAPEDRFQSAEQIKGALDSRGAFRAAAIAAPKKIIEQPNRRIRLLTMVAFSLILLGCFAATMLLTQHHSEPAATDNRPAHASPEYLVREAEDRLDEHMYTFAVDKAKAAMALINPNDPAQRHLYDRNLKALAMSTFNAGKNEEAIPLLKELWSRTEMERDAPLCQECAFKIGIGNMMLNNYETAIEYLENPILDQQRDSDYLADTKIQLATCYWVVGSRAKDKAKCEEAIAMAKRVAAYQPMGQQGRDAVNTANVRLRDWAKVSLNFR